MSFKHRFVKISKRFQSLSIQIKLIIAFFFISFIIISVNMGMYLNINTIIGEIDAVYQSNVRLTKLRESLDRVHTNLTEYLNTKSTDAINSYYRSEQEFRQYLETLNQNIYGNDMLITQKNIRNMSEQYLSITLETVQAKRGRNVEKYRSKYEEASNVFSVIDTFVYSLNNQQFESNSMNYEALVKTLRNFEFISMFVLIIISFTNIVLVFVMTRRITKPLIVLAKTANEVASGNFNVNLVEVKAMDEVGVVSKAFNKMVLNISLYIEQIKKNMEKENAMKEKELIMESHLKDAQLKYLQAQINPHFLFNTLNAGAQLAMMEGADKTCLFVENMADFFRYNIKKISQDASLEEELKLVDNYIYILNVRFVGEIHYDKKIEEEFLTVRVPSMILQPIIENAVNYGIHDIEWEGNIHLNVYRLGTHLCISIQDNGIGMSQEKIHEVMNGEVKDKDLSSNSNGIGLTNVIQRLKYYYNAEDVLEIKSDGENKGTEVIIYIPMDVSGEE